MTTNNSKEKLSKEYKEKLIRKSLEYPCPHIRKKIVNEVLLWCGYSDEYYDFCRELQRRELEDDQIGVCCGSE